MKSIYDIDLNSADGSSNFLQQFKGKAAVVVNTTVGCGNANQLEVMQWLQDKYGGDDFQIIAIPTNDYCGPGVTKGKWSQGITCGMDSQKYGEEVYNTTFKYSEMVSSNPNELVSKTPGKNGLGQDHKEPHDLYKEISSQMRLLEIDSSKQPQSDVKYKSFWLNKPMTGQFMGGNYEKYLIDKDGYVYKHYPCTVLNYDIEKTLKESLEKEGKSASLGEHRSQEVFEEEYSLFCQDIENLISGKRSIINPLSILTS
jgi:glutathione peroxidase-family protein